MPQFAPGEEYDRGDVSRTIGAAQSDDPVIAGDGGIALLVSADAGDDGASFPERSTLHWPGSLPWRAADPGSRILVFVDRGQKAVRFVGQGRVASYSSGKALPFGFRFAIKPALDRSDWLELVGGKLPPAGPAPEAPLVSLTAASSPEDRWNALQTFVERWYQRHAGPLQSSPAHAIGPMALQRLLSLQEAIPDLIRQNRLVARDDLLIEDGKIVFLLENQAVCLWATEPAGTDPRVWYRNNEDGEPWIEEPERLSGFLIQAVLFEAILHPRFGASTTEMPADKLQRILARVEPLSNGRWNWLGLRFYARDGAFVMTAEHGAFCQVWLAARTPLELSRFDDLVTEDWDRIAF